MPITSLSNLDPESEMPFRTHVFIGAIFLCAGLYALWNNELRFDLVSAAQSTPLVHQMSNAARGDNFSFSGQLDPSLEIRDRNIGSINGYMAVRRVAEIYAWDLTKRTYRPDRWEMEWQYKPESNSRNKSLNRQFKNRRLLASSYVLGELSIKKKRLHFIEDYQPISTDNLKWQNTDLSPTSVTSEHFYFSANGATTSDKPQLGDQRVSYKGIPLPTSATYFGRFDGESGVADMREYKKGRVNKIIRNDGILHHIVAGGRDTAIEAIGANQSKMKLITRIGGTLFVILGIYFLLDTVLGVFTTIPLIGEYISSSIIYTSIVIGVLLSGLTITMGFLAAHWMFVVALCAITLMVFRGQRHRS